MSTHQHLLTIHDVFHNACSAAQHNQDNDHQQGNIISFIGKVIHTIGTTQINTLIAGKQDQDIEKYPLHPEAFSFFKTHSKGSLPDQIIWLGPVQAAVTSDPTNSIQHQAALGSNPSPLQVTINTQRFKEQDNVNDVVIILDSDNDDEQPFATTEDRPPHLSDNRWDDNGDDIEVSSVVSWSDSNASLPEIDGDDSNTGGLKEDMIPTPLIAVLFDSALHQEGSYSAQPYKHDDIVELTKAMILQKDLGPFRVITCVGIPGTTLRRRSQSFQYMRTKLSDEHILTRNESTPIEGTMPMSIKEQSEPSFTRKRPRPETVVLDDDSDSESLQKMESSKKRCSKAEESDHSLFKNWSHQAIHGRDLDSLELLVRIQSDSESIYDQISRAGLGDKIDYISNVWCTLPPSTSSTTSSQTSSLSSDSATELKASYDSLTRHICRIKAIQRVQIRAVCADCENDYKSQRCTFGCSSQKWRTQVQMECILSDGTSIAELRLHSDQEAMMWTLLGLKESSLDKSTSTKKQIYIPDDPHAQLRNKVLRIVARRGDLTFKSGSPPELTTQNKDKENNKTNIKNKGRPDNGTMQDKGYVECIDHDRSQRAVAEEKIWLDICTLKPRKEQSFVLYATTSSSLASKLSSAQTQYSNTNTESMTQQKVLKRSWIKIQEWKRVETLIRPNLVLWAIAAEWIRPQAETKMLLNSLLQKPL